MATGLATDLASSSSAGASDAVRREELDSFVRTVEQRLAGYSESIADPDPAPIADPEGSYVSNVDTGILHWTRAGPGWAAVLQVTRGCGWKFINRRFERTALIPAGISWKSVCDRCLPSLRLSLRGDDLSDLD